MVRTHVIALGVILAAAVTAQVNRTATQPAKVPAAAFDLNGTWESSHGDPGTAAYGVEKVLVYQLRNVIQIFNIEGRLYIRPGDRFLTAVFPSAASIPARTSAQIHALQDARSGMLLWLSTTLSVDDNDHFRIAEILKFHRTSTRQIRDVSCEAGNPSHVGGEDAFMRGNAYFELKDLVTANCWFHAGAVEGYARAQSSYAYALFHGRGIKQDTAAAQEWAQKSADRHDAYGEFIAGSIELQRGFGLGIERAQEYKRLFDQHDPDKAYFGSQTAERQAAIPSFIKDETFTYDLSGEWKLVFPAGVRSGGLVLVDLKQGDNIQMIVDSPNGFYPFGATMFNGRYANNRITGQWMNAPAHLNASGRYDSTAVELQILNPTNLVVSPSGIKVTRSDEQGANKICDPVKYADMEQARTFIFATRDFQLKNYGNAACWMYVSASQGHHEAALELAMFLHLGTGVQKDNDQAFVWVKKSAEAGNKRAQRFLAHCYQLGIGVRPDPAVAQSWIAKANDREPEPELPQTSEQALMGLLHTYLSTVCANPASGRESRVATYVSRGMSEGKAQQAAREDESETAFLCQGAQHPPGQR